MRILVTGWRDANEEHRHVVAAALRTALGIFQPGSFTLVHGACSGVDRWAAWWASTHANATVEAHPAEAHGAWPACGPKRNSHMVSLGAELCLAFPGPGSKGTHDCLTKAIRAGIVTHVYPLSRAG